MIYTDNGSKSSLGAANNNSWLGTRYDASNAWNVNSNANVNNNNTSNVNVVAPCFNKTVCGCLRTLRLDMKGFRYSVPVNVHISFRGRNWYRESGKIWVYRIKKVLLEKKVIYEELYATFMKRVKQKHITKESYLFERSAGLYLDLAATSLIDKTWKVIGYFPFHVFHPHRIINAPFYADRVVEQWFVERFIIPAFTDKIMPFNMSCQKNKGPFKNMTITKNAIRQMYESFGTDWVVYQFDGEGYFDNISHDFAINLIGSQIDPDWLWLYERIVESFSCPNGYAMTADPEHKYGFPKGNLPSQWTGIIALNELDHMIAEDPRCYHSSRYMDDAISFYRKIGDAKHAHHMTEKWLKDRKVGVRLHPKKTAYFPISRGFTYCGWHYALDDDGTIHIRIKNSKKKEEKNRLKVISKGVNDGKINIVDARRTQEGMFEYLSHGTESERLINYLYRTYPIP